MRWNDITKLLNCAGLKHTRFPATDGYKIKITDLQNNEIFYGIDIKNGLKKIENQLKYKITCNPEDQDPTEFNFKGYLHLNGNLSSAGELGLWCSSIRVWKDAKNNNYKKILVFDDDVIPTINFKQNLNKYTSYLPKDFDIAYLDFKLGTNDNTLIKINNYVNGFNTQASGWGSYAALLSNNGIERLLSEKEYTFPLDHFYWYLTTGMGFVNYPAGQNNNLTNPLKPYSSSQKLLDVIEMEDENSIKAMGRKL